MDKKLIDKNKLKLKKYKEACKKYNQSPNYKTAVKLIKARGIQLDKKILHLY